MIVSWLSDRLIPQGKIGLSHSPGAWNAGRDTELEALQSLGVNGIVCLQEAFELDYSDIDDETIEQRADAVQRLGMRFTHFPIPDFGAPRIRHAQTLIADIEQHLADEQHIVIHCFAGLGRAGTIAASLLTARGLDAAHAIDAVRRARPGAIQSKEQMDFIAAFAARARS